MYYFLYLCLGMPFPQKQHVIRIIKQQRRATEEWFSWENVTTDAQRITQLSASRVKPHASTKILYESLK